MTGRRLSVVIPVRNGMPYLPRAIDSALAGLSDDDELIVVENGSTDGTSEWLETVDDRVRVLRANQPRGAAENWTAACEASSGEWVKLLCADDLVLHGGLERQLAAAESHPGVVLVGSRRRVIDETDRTLLRAVGLSGVLGRRTGGAAVQAILTRGENVFGEPSSVLFRGDALRASLPFGTDFPYLTDVDMYVRVLRHGDALGLPTVDAAFRVSATSWSAAVGRGQLDEVVGWLEAMDRTYGGSSSALRRAIRTARIRTRFVARRAVSVYSARRPEAMS